MKLTELKIITKGKKWGPYTAADIFRFIAERRISLEDTIWDSSYRDDIMTIGEWVDACQKGTLPKPRRTRRTKSEIELDNERKKLSEEKTAFEAYRKSELQKIETSKLDIEGKFGVFFAVPSGKDDLRFYGRILGLKGKVTKEEIKKSYKLLMTQCHPDKHTTSHPAIRSLSEHQTKLVNEAFSVFKKHYNIE